MQMRLAWVPLSGFIQQCAPGTRFALLDKSAIRRGGPDSGTRLSDHVRSTLRPSFACALVLGVCLCTPLRAQQPFGTVGKLEEVGIDQQIDAQLPLDLKFRDETGKEVTLGEYFNQGKPVVLSLVYFQCPMLCSLSMEGLVHSLKTLPLKAGEDFTALTISFDPREDTKLAADARQTALKRYDRPGAENGWHFLTGEADQIRELTKAAGFRYAYDEQTKQFIHAAAIMVITPQGKISRYFFGVEYPPRDLKFGLIEASSGKLGTPTDRVLLLCFHYDPTTGKYGFAISTALRILGVATLAALVGGIMWMLRHERKSDAPLPPTSDPHEDEPTTN